MLSIAEIARNTQGALRMLQLDPAAPFQFDNTPEACLRSFRVIALAAQRGRAAARLQILSWPHAGTTPPCGQQPR